MNLNYSGTKGGKEFEGGQGLDQDLVLGSNTMIPGFEERDHWNDRWRK
ncbi:MAG: hypothetical protein CM15mP51_25120 [Porticoccaceae bacterium]|nr:MAG: hypothetical protein CM15mP51_25120 [Porticoccaceae bacterium]